MKLLKTKKKLFENREKQALAAICLTIATNLQILLLSVETAKHV